MSSERSLITVDSSKQVSLVSGFNNFIDALNPLGNLAKVVAEIVACRVETKRLQNEALEIQYEYEANNRKIDATLKIAIQSSEDRRMAMERLFTHAERDMRQHHIYGNQLVRTLQNMNQLATRRDISFDEKKLVYETIRSLSKDMVSAQKVGVESLNALVQSTRHDLLAVPSLSKLLSPGR